MSDLPYNPMELALRRLSKQSILSADEEDALLKIGGHGQRMKAGEEYMHREQEIRSSCLLVEGLIARTAIERNGARAITGFYVKGDIPDLHSYIRPSTNSSLRAITECKILTIPHVSLRLVTDLHPGIMEAFWRYTAWDAANAAEWVLNVGSRTAFKRIAHLMCELAVRTDDVTPGPCSFVLPLGQSVLADATGMSVVHVNRCLQRLRKNDLLLFAKGKVTIPDWRRLTKVAEFDDAYLIPERPLRLSPINPALEHANATVSEIPPGLGPVHHPHEERRDAYHRLCHYQVTPAAKGK